MQTWKFNLDFYMEEEEQEEEKATTKEAL